MVNLHFKGGRGVWENGHYFPFSSDVELYLRSLSNLTSFARPKSGPIIKVPLYMYITDIMTFYDFDIIPTMQIAQSHSWLARSSRFQF